MEIMLDDSQADTESNNGMYTEPSTSIWVPEVSKTVGESLDEDASGVFAQMHQGCSDWSNPEQAPKPLAMSPTPAPVDVHCPRKVKRRWPKKRVAIAEEVQEGLGLLNAQSMTRY